MNKATNGYYHVELSSQNVFNRDAFMARLANIFDEQVNGSLAPDIELLAYYLGHDRQHLLVYAIDENLLKTLSITLEGHVAGKHFTYHRLSGPHEALTISKRIHLTKNPLDRLYSSIDFYLGGRRESWVQRWRLARLFDHNPAYYFAYLHSSLEKSSLPQ